MVRVCGFIKARACAIWRLQIEVESEIWNLGLVRLQNLHIEYELKVRQKERVPFRFDTRLWLYGLHGRVQI